MRGGQLFTLALASGIIYSNCRDHTLLEKPGPQDYIANLTSNLMLGA